MRDLGDLERQLHSRLVTPAQRQAAARALAAERSLESAEILARAVVLLEDEQIHEIALAALQAYPLDQLQPIVGPIAQRSRNTDLLMILAGLSVEMPDRSAKLPAKPPVAANSIIAELYQLAHLDNAQRQSLWLEPQNSLTWEMLIDKAIRAQQWEPLWTFCTMLSPAQALPILVRLSRTVFEPAHNAPLYRMLCRQSAECQRLPQLPRWMRTQTLHPSNRYHNDTLHYSPDGQYLVSSHNKQFNWWCPPDTEPHGLIRLDRFGSTVYPCWHTNHTWALRWRRNVAQLFALSASQIPVVEIVAPRPLKSLAVSVDDQHVFLGSRQGQIYMWHVGEQKLVRTLSMGHGTPINRLAVSPNGQWLAGTTRRQVKIWSLSTFQPVVEFDCFRRNVKTLLFSPDSQRLLVCPDSIAPTTLWDVPSGELVWRKSGLSFARAAITPDGKAAVVSSSRAGVQWLHIDNGKAFASMRFEAENVAFHPTEMQWATYKSSKEQLISVWAEAPEYQMLHTPVVAWGDDLAQLTEPPARPDVTVVDAPLDERQKWFTYCRTFALLQRPYDVDVAELGSAEDDPFAIELGD